MRKSLLILIPVILVFLGVTPALTEEVVEEIYYGGDILFTTPVKSVIFSHKVHTQDLGFNCQTCHDGIFSMARGASESMGDFNMKSLAEGRYCGSCHNGEMAFSSETQCARCHTGVKGFMRFPEELRDAKASLMPREEITLGEGGTSSGFSHQVHTGMFECSECHPEVFKLKQNTTGITMEGIYQGRFCGRCHNGEVAFGSDNCGRCHPQMN